MTLTTIELKLLVDMLAEHGDGEVSTRLLEDRIRHDITAREAVDGQIDTLVDAYGSTALTRFDEWGIPGRAWDKGLRDIMKNLAVDAAGVGHAEGHTCSCREAQ